MNKKNHFISEVVIFLLLWGFIDSIKLSMIILPIFWGAMFPDFDHQFKSHRNIIFHSIIPNLLIWFYDSSLMNFLFIISVAIHLLGDLLPMIKKRGGFSCIDMMFKRMNTFNSAIWLILNIFTSIVLCILVI